MNTQKREPMGRSPLYYYDGAQGRVYGRSVLELLAKGVPRKLSRAGLRSYLEYGCVYEPLTLIDGVFAEMPAWAPSFEAKPWKSDELQEAVTTAVDQAVAREMGTRPAAFLSGGIDSSAVVAAMRRLTKEPIDTFCIIHEDPKCDERVWARKVAEANGTRHHELLLTPAMIKADICRALDAYDQPSLDGINSYFAAKMVKDLGFDMALSGTGGDELFVGYGDFAKQRMAYKYGKFLQPFPRWAGRLVETLAPNERIRKMGMLMGCSGDVYYQVRRVFSDTMIEGLVAIEGELPRLSQIEGPLSGDLINHISWLELRTSVLSMYLRDGWNMAEANGVEVRCPLLDPALVQLLFSVPGQMKVGEVSKHLLVRSAGKGLPMECVTRPKKGFGLPFDLYFREALKDEMAAFLLGELWDGLDKATIQKLWRDYLAGKVWWTRLWGLFVLSYWIKRNRVSL